ncbi:MAG TPA: poly(A) polymerase, partial [Coleofasciculaceae cyanobacterium]
STAHRPSEIAQHLREYKLPTLVLVALQSPRAIRRKLWRYLTTWETIQAPINGNDLRKLGYKPGPQYREILDALLAATLDGMIQDEGDAQAFLVKNYPRPSHSQFKP